MNDLFVLIIFMIAAVIGYAAASITRQILQYRLCFRHMPLGMHPTDAKVVNAICSAVRWVLTRLLMVWRVLTKRHLIVLHYDEKNDSAGGVATIAPRRERMWPSNVVWNDMPRELFVESVDRSAEHIPTVESQP